MQRRFSKPVIVVFALAGLVLGAACGLLGGLPMPTAQEVVDTDVPPYRATPVAQSPASGICGTAPGDVVTFTIRPDVPDPRCAAALSGQTLRVVNGREEVIQVRIGLFEAQVEPGGEAVFDTPLGDYLLPGVHVVGISPCCSPELILKPEGE